MKLLKEKYYESYLKIAANIEELIDNCNFFDKSVSFEYLTKASAVFSSNIEGNSINLNSYMNYEMNKLKFKDSKEFDEIEDLIAAYKFAQANELDEKNMLLCHKFLSKTLLIDSKRGNYRTEKVGVFGKTGLIYLAIEPEYVQQEMKYLFNDIYQLLNTKLATAEVFYYASMIHLRFVHIHPFMDGNGRIARLIEKWFITSVLGIDFWKLSIEENYKNKQQEYYNAINIGVNYYELNYDLCLPFLSLSIECLK